MYFHAKSAGVSARHSLTATLRNQLLKSACAALIVTAGFSAAKAQEIPSSDAANTGNDAELQSIEVVEQNMLIGSQRSDDTDGPVAPGEMKMFENVRFSGGLKLLDAPSGNITVEGNGHVLVDNGDMHGDLTPNNGAAWVDGETGNVAVGKGAILTVGEQGETHDLLVDGGHAYIYGLSGDTFVNTGGLLHVKDEGEIGALTVNSGDAFVDGKAGHVSISGGQMRVGAKGTVEDVVLHRGSALIYGTSGDIQVHDDTLLSVHSSGVSGNVTVNGGTAFIGGNSQDVTVHAGGLLLGNGTVHDLTAHTGATVAPGDPVGTLHVTGNATFDRGSLFDVEIAPDKSLSDRLAVAGDVTLSGGRVNLRFAGQEAPMSEQQMQDLFLGHYTILTSDKRINGAFETITPQYNYISPSLTYAADGSAVAVGFDLIDPDTGKPLEGTTDQQPQPGGHPDGGTKPETDQSKMQRIEAKVKNIVLADATSPNQKSVGEAIKQLDLGNPLLGAVLFSSKNEVLNYDAPSGDIYASVRSVLAEDGRFIRDAANSRIRAAFTDASGYHAALTERTVKGPAVGFNSAVPTTDIWGHAYGSWGHAQSDGNAAAYSRNIGGIVTGVDGRIGEKWRLGVLAAYGNTSLHGAGSSASADSYQLGVYGGTKMDALTLSFGTSFAHHAIDTNRKLRFGRMAETDSASYAANALQVFGEAAYRIDTPYVMFEPFAGVAYTHLKADDFRETGGVAALSGASAATDLTTTTLGLRTSYSVALSEKTMVTARGMAGWKHAFGDTAPDASMAFASGRAFSIKGLGTARDAALIEAGLDFDIGNATSIGVSYAGQFSDRNHDNALKADLTVRF
ncbi:autotransporter domain-containing protein [Phyllobacterium sp. P30BS-XVII]|uniref:autotransporter outer membrane beta-barrel domain-containing protein n=1 Tax=Phyllobacterium sp. P30BS-XVII TaxID=2587046 RepID=UPI0015F78D31|nr:autotransporter domain-containing protein [Phyllobacterium sp. P30BS-XVII]MBA8901330.1 outer membrane autotransporter protein [Phyllobacterium sp. P30BS-XVII]